jgi:hypothetical protein
MLKSRHVPEEDPEAPCEKYKESEVHTKQGIAAFNSHA